MADYQKQCGNNLEWVDKFLMNVMEILVAEASDDFWKILKYPTIDATVNPTYTISIDDKKNLIKQNTQSTRIRRLKFNNDISTDAHTEIRIFDGAWFVPSFGNYEMTYGIEIISHNAIIFLEDGRTTLNVLRNEIYNLFNGRFVDKNVGRITNAGTSGSITIFNADFQGYQLSLKGASA